MMSATSEVPMNARTLSGKLSGIWTYSAFETNRYMKAYSYNAAFGWRVFLILFWSLITLWLAATGMSSSLPLAQLAGVAILIFGFLRISNVFRDHTLFIDEEKILIPVSTLSRRHHTLYFKDIKNFELMNGEDLVLERRDGKYLVISEYVLGKENFLEVLHMTYENIRKVHPGERQVWKLFLYDLVPWLPVAGIFSVVLYLLSAVSFKL